MSDSWLGMHIFLQLRGLICPLLTQYMPLPRRTQQIHQCLVTMASIWPFHAMESCWLSNQRAACLYWAVIEGLSIGEGVSRVDWRFCQPDIYCLLEVSAWACWVAGVVASAGAWAWTTAAQRLRYRLIPLESGRTPEPFTHLVTYICNVHPWDKHPLLAIVLVWHVPSLGVKLLMYLFMQGRVYSKTWVSRLVEPVGNAIVVTSCWEQVRDWLCTKQGNSPSTL